MHGVSHWQYLYFMFQLFYDYNNMMCYDGFVSGSFPSPCSHPPPGSVQRWGIHQQYSGLLILILCMCIILFFMCYFLLFIAEVYTCTYVQCFLVISEVHKMHGYPCVLLQHIIMLTCIPYSAKFSRHLYFVDWPLKAFRCTMFAEWLLTGIHAFKSLHVIADISN